MKDEDWERFKNFVIYKTYMTDKERNEFAPWIAGIVLAFLVIVGIVWLLKK